MDSISSIGERQIDEGLRMEAHPGIVFRNGPSGRRAGLAAGPDVWGGCLGFCEACVAALRNEWPSRRPSSASPTSKPA